MDGIILAGLAAPGTNIWYILEQLEYDVGLFSFILPLLLVFAIVFGILSKSEILGKNKGVQLVIAIVVAFLAVQFGNVGFFFSTIFSKFAIGLSILLIAIVLMGLFMPMGEGKGKWGNYVLLGIGALVFVFSALSSFTEYTFWTSWWWYQYWTAIIAAIIVIGVIVLIVALGKRSQ